MPASVLTNRMIEASKLRSKPFYRMSCLTGLFTGVAAGTPTAGHLIGLRNGEAAGGLEFNITRLLLKFWTTVGFTALQEFRLDLLKATAYSVAHTVGTGATDAAMQARASDLAANTTIVGHTAGTDAITAGTHTIGGLVMSVGIQELADGAAVPKKAVFEERVSVDKFPIEVLKPQEGLILRNGTVAMGAGGVVRAMLIAEGWLNDPTP